MSDIKALLREAATYVGPCGDTELVEQLLAAAESLGEPVAWVMLTSEGGIDWGEDCFSDCPDTGRAPLFLAPQPAVPEWKDPYTNNGDRRPDTDYRHGWNACRDAMLAAAEDDPDDDFTRGAHDL